MVSQVAFAAPEKTRIKGKGHLVESDRLKLEIIVGSVREGRFGPTVVNWLAGQAREHGGFDVDIIDLADFDFPASMASSPDTDAFAQRIDAADVVVVVTPEYNHSYPGPLKTAIDAIGSPWHGKPVGLVSYGGMSGGLRSVEPLRVVFAEVHAMTIRDTVSFHGARKQFGSDGQPLDPVSVNAAAGVMLDKLEWWGIALRNARAIRPYGQKVAV
jgi:NAD(P)H-dependent FMN reductase